MALGERYIGDLYNHLFFAKEAQANEYCNGFVCENQALAYLTFRNHISLFLAQKSIAKIYFPTIETMNKLLICETINIIYIRSL